jgi:nucleoside-diphosphate-sugar epimerase
MNIRKALVTGSTGFVGSNLVHRLIIDGWEIHVIVRSDSKLDMLAEIIQEITVHEHDGSTHDMYRIMAIVKPEVVFHMASLVLSENTDKDIVNLVQSNILFGIQLLEAMAAHGVTRIINTGTSWQHYENKSYSPVNLYAATKQAFEDMLQYYVEAKGVQAITLKLFDTYGSNDPRPKLLNLIKKTSEDGSILAMSPGEQFVDLVHINDVVDAFIVASERIINTLVVGHEKYAVSSDKPLQLRLLVTKFEHVVGKKISIEWGGIPYRKREVMNPWNNGQRLFGWKPKISLDLGIAELLGLKTRDT